MKPSRNYAYKTIPVCNMIFFYLPSITNINSNLQLFFSVTQVNVLANEFVIRSHITIRVDMSTQASLASHVRAAGICNHHKSYICTPTLDVTNQ